MASVAAADNLARFLFDKRREFSPAAMKPNPSAFMPRMQDNGLSIFGVDGLDDQQVRAIGDDVAAVRQRSLKGWTEITSQAVYSLGLSVVIDNQPARHGEITGWPPAEEERLAKATELANLAHRLFLVP